MKRLLVPMAAVLAAALVLALSALAATACNGGEDQEDRAALFQQFIDTLNRGDVAGAVAFFTDDGALVGSVFLAGCFGKEDIQFCLESRYGGGSLNLLSAEQSDNTLTGRVELTNDLIRGAGLERIVAFFTLEARGDKFSLILLDDDLTDEQTATFSQY